MVHDVRIVGGSFKDVSNLRAGHEYALCREEQKLFTVLTSDCLKRLTKSKVWIQEYADSRVTVHQQRTMQFKTKIRNMIVSEINYMHHKTSIGFFYVQRSTCKNTIYYHGHESNSSRTFPESKTNLVTMAQPKLKLTNCKCLSLWVSSILIIFTSGNVEIRAKAFQVVMDFLHWHIEN